MNVFELEEKIGEFDQKLKLIIGILRERQRTNPEEVFFDNQEFLHVMNISKRTAQQWRDNGLIGFCQIGSKIYYRLPDILALLEDNYKPAAKQ
ncbi:hypothetical protein EMA8858_00337 [Emticicia aquatica]|uniref:Helix-turn-helix domain-containing protein n=1 Tax=Emticicia aquatica TaxID=1681835 RepID=A0ABN8EN48_9BACT|nr:helix-turn-helix domain-containing protein [Emticicia aquatica]CAH0994228.1 hypothetical protein EMA8858_00337 [Emticicia aquatica]